MNKHPLHFVVQKHAATRLHYDFRLELNGVLKSWAVPKGPSVNPSDKRLAIMVEDHPYDYRTFEGNIPQGHYGAGSVMIWDEGTYTDIWGDDPQKSETELRKELKDGEIKFILNGNKLKGEYALVKMGNDPEDKKWLLIKKKDQFASAKKDITRKDHSAFSGKSMEEISGRAKKSKAAASHQTHARDFSGRAF